MYVLPRGLESLWSVLRRRSYVPFVPGGEVLLTRYALFPLLRPDWRERTLTLYCSLGLSMVMTTYSHEPKMLSGLVRSVLYQFVGQG